MLVPRATELDDSVGQSSLLPADTASGLLGSETRPQDVSLHGKRRTLLNDRCPENGVEW